MRRWEIWCAAGSLCLMAGAVPAQEQVVTVTSAHGLQETVARFEEALQQEGIVAQREAAGGQPVRGGSEEFVFANPYAATYAGRCRWDDRQDQPFSTRIFLNSDGQVALSYTAPAERVNEFGVIECGAIVARINKTLNKLIKYAAQ